MKHLKIWQKLALMGVLFMAPFAVVTYTMVYEINRLGIHATSRELQGLDYFAKAMPLLKDLQHHRGLNNAVLSGDSSFRDALLEKRAAVERDLQGMDEIDRRLGETLGTSQRWAAVRAGIDHLLDDRASAAAERFERHTRTIDELTKFMTLVTDRSGLTIDAGLDTRHLIRVAVSQGPLLTEMLAQARGLGSGMLASGNRPPEIVDRLRRLSITADYMHQAMDDAAVRGLSVNDTLRNQVEPDLKRAHAAVERGTTAIATLVAGETVPKAAEYYAAVTQSIDAISDSSTVVSDALKGVIGERLTAFEHEVRWTLIWAGLGLLLVSVLGFFIIRDITVAIARVVSTAHQIAMGDVANRPQSAVRRDEVGALTLAFDQMVTALNETVGVAERIAGGDLTATVAPRSDRDVLSHALGHMVHRLSALVSDVQRSGIQVNTSVNEIAATAKQQQATAAEIAATTSQIGATSKQISATSKDLARTMTEVSVVAEESATLGTNGQAGLARMELTMRHVMEAASSINAKLSVLNEKAGNITQVVTTITKVADQTNLLSLNAAIEAEKAGEYGRGFAVVATEIRRLADQTAVATFDIEQTIKEIQGAVSAGVMGMDKFSEEVRRGIQDVEQVSGQLSQIIQQVQALVPRFEVVNEGMQAQATGAEQITLALTQLGDAAHQTVESLRQSSQAIDGLNQAAVGMRNGVSRFTVAA